MGKKKIFNVSFKEHFRVEKGHFCSVIIKLGKTCVLPNWRYARKGQEEQTNGKKVDECPSPLPEEGGPDMNFSRPANIGKSVMPAFPPGRRLEEEAFRK